MPEESETSRFMHALPEDREVRTADLRALYERDQDELFRLAIIELSEGASIAVRGLQRLARTLSVLMRDGFSVESAANQLYARGRRGGVLPLDNGSADLEFVQRLYTGSGYTSKMDAQRRSRECLDFFLQDQQWDDGIRSTRLLRVAPEDANAILGGLPRYQYVALLDCAREIVRCPSAVYKGLRNDGPMKSGGMAFCGLPSRWLTNTAVSMQIPPGFTFLVFANQEDYVFDWDWVPASDADPTVPKDAQERFEGPVHNVHGELLLANVRDKSPLPFRAHCPWFSRQGDCVFWYHSQEETYARRYDDYLTAFFSPVGRQGADRCVGFKLKVVSRLFETLKKWAAPNEGIQVRFNRDTVEVELAFLMKAWAAASLPTTQELLPGMELMKLLGDQAINALMSTPKLAISRKDLEELRAMQPA